MCEKIEVSNERYLRHRGIELKLVKKILRTSWIEIKFINTNPKLQLEKNSERKRSQTYESVFLDDPNFKMSETELTSNSTANSMKAILSINENEVSVDLEDDFPMHEILQLV